MEKDGYIELEPNTDGRRSVYVILTDKGREKLAQAGPVFDEIITWSMATTDTSIVNRQRIFSRLW